MAVRAFSQSLSDAFDLAHARLNMIFVDVVWRGIWLIACVALAAGMIGWFGMRLSAFEWQGPDLAASRPIMLLYAARQFWAAESGAILTAVLLFALSALAIWLALEAYF